MLNSVENWFTNYFSLPTFYHFTNIDALLYKIEKNCAVNFRQSVKRSLPPIASINNYQIMAGSSPVDNRLSVCIKEAEYEDNTHSYSIHTGGYKYY